MLDKITTGAIMDFGSCPDANAWIGISIFFLVMWFITLILLFKKRKIWEMIFKFLKLFSLIVSVCAVISITFYLVTGISFITTGVPSTVIKDSISEIVKEIKLKFVPKDL